MNIAYQLRENHPVFQQKTVEMRYYSIFLYLKQHKDLRIHY